MARGKLHTKTGSIMKEFLKYTLATVTGIVMLFSALALVSVVALIGMVATGESAPTVKDNTVLVLQLSGALDERAQEDALGGLTAGDMGSIGLDDITAAIRKAKGNDKVSGIYIEAGLFGLDSPASAQAIRNCLEDFRESGKWIVAYADTYTQYTYYICSVADRVLLNPQGMVDWHGLSAQPVFLKDMLEKFGVRVQLAKVGKYKSAPETFTADSMSEPNRRQVEAYINGIWKVMLDDVSESRKVGVDALNRYADGFAAMADPQDYVRMRLVDKLVYADEVKGEVRRMLGIGPEEHSHEGARFEEIASLTADFTPPEDACPSYRLALQQLQQFKDALHEHIHLENNLIFPRALEMEQFNTAKAE